MSGFIQRVVDNINTEKLHILETLLENEW